MTRSPENAHILLFWHLSCQMKPAKIQTETNKTLFYKMKILGGLILTVYPSCTKSIIQEIQPTLTIYEYPVLYWLHMSRKTLCPPQNS